MARKKKETQNSVVKKERKKKVEKPYNNGTMSSAAFFQFLRSSLRRRSVIGWKPIQACRNAAKRAYVGENKRQKVEFQCAICKNWFPDKQVNVHHLVECGQLRSFDDLPGFVERLFCEKEGLIVACQNCHSEIHKK